MIPAAKLANADQVATAVISTVADGAAAGSRAVDIRVWNGIDVRLLPDRGLDIGAAWFRGIPLAWISPAGEQPPPRPEELVGNAWRDAWGGGLVTTCGLSNVGAASEGHGQHGTYTARAAADLQVERTTSEVTATGTVVDAPFTLSRRIVTTVGQGLVRIDDRVVNDSDWTAAAPLLYHVNFGAPAVGRGRLPRDGCAGGRATRRCIRSRARHVGRAAGAGRRSAGARLRARRRIVGAPHEPEARRRAHRSARRCRGCGSGSTRRAGPTRSGSSRRTARCSAASTTSRRAGCRFSTRARRARPGSRSPHGRSSGDAQRSVSACGVPARAGSAPAAPGAA